ncbi:MAG: Fe-S-containing protein [Sodalis sp. (in: enterobacteria)]
MIYFFVTTLQSFFCVALLSSLLWSRNSAPTLSPLVWTTFLSFILGLFFNLLFQGSQLLQLLIISAEILILLIFLLTFWQTPKIGCYLWQGILVFGGARHWGLDSNLSWLTSTYVLNTDFLLNLTAIALALVLLILVALVCSFLLVRLRYLYWFLTLLVFFMLWLPLSGTFFLLLMKLQIVPLTKSLLSFVSHMTNNAAMFNWVGACLLLLLCLCWLPTLRSYYFAMYLAREPIVYRLARAKQRTALWLTLIIVNCAAIIMASQLWWNRVASQPTRLSEAKMVTLASDSQVHLPIEQVRNGKLHRFVWEADDGKTVRFFVINRYPDKLRFGVVFDACLLCGDQGYIMDGNQVICVSCGVHIFIPSIGKEGGCNPVPIENWYNDVRELVIPRDALVVGTNYFSTTLLINRG